MPQPKKSASTSSTARKPAARKPAAKKAAAARRPAATTRRPAAAPKPAATPGLTSMPTTPEEVVANLNVLRERLVSSLTLTTERLQDAVDDAVRRGRMTRKDAEDLLATLVTQGRAQTEQLLADVEQLLGRNGDGLRERAAGSSDAVLRTVDRARRRVGVGTFPILGYDDLTAAQITKRLDDLTPAQLRKVRDHERRHDARKSVLAAIERKLP
jgi:polyhydroxyalkanoate synthesis regulator phasin